MLGLRHYHGVAIDLYQGDLTQFVCDVMVNAANAALSGGGGVDGAIHKAAGPSVLAECRALGKPCPTGEAVITGAGDLPATWVCHAVGPVWQGGDHGEAALLAAAYRNSFIKADQLGARHVAFPSLSTGAYRYPVEQAATTAITAIKEAIDGERHSPGVARVTFALFSLPDYHVFQKALFAIFPEDDA